MIIAHFPEMSSTIFAFSKLFRISFSESFGSGREGRDRGSVEIAAVPGQRLVVAVEGIAPVLAMVAGMNDVRQHF